MDSKNDKQIFTLIQRGNVCIIVYTRMGPLGSGEMMNHTTVRHYSSLISLLRRNVLKVITSQTQGKAMVFSKARLYRRVRGLGWSNLHSSVYYPVSVLYCTLSQEYLKARLCHCPHPCHELIPPLPSNSSLHSNMAQFGRGIKSQRC